ncbi:MAG: ABC transporter permease subunit [Spirochaetia bacterium]
MNKQFYFGIVLLSLLVLISLFGPIFAPYAPDFAESIRVVETEGGGTNYIFSPQPPDAVHPFGTDRWGYDLLTLMLYGAKYSIFIVILIAFFRIIIGAAIGFVLGFPKKSKSVADKFKVLNAMPVFIIVYFITIGFTINPEVSMGVVIFWQVFFIVLFGLPPIITSTQERIIYYRKQEFVVAAEAAGAGDLRILFHILPHIVENLVTLFVNEFIRVLNLIGQLGIFHVFIGGTILTTAPPLFHSMSHEWAGLIGMARNSLFSNQWVLAFPLIGYFILLISFILIARGVELHFRKKYGRPKHL